MSHIREDDENTSIQHSPLRRGYFSEICSKVQKIQILLSWKSIQRASLYAQLHNKGIGILFVKHCETECETFWT